jgi:hypothetical protein
MFVFLLPPGKSGPQAAHVGGSWMVICQRAVPKEEIEDERVRVTHG